MVPSFSSIRATTKPHSQNYSVHFRDRNEHLVDASCLATGLGIGRLKIRLSTCQFCSNRPSYNFAGELLGPCWNCGEASVPQLQRPQKLQMTPLPQGPVSCIYRAAGIYSGFALKRVAQRGGRKPTFLLGRLECSADRLS